MARAKKPPFTIDLHRLVEALGKEEFTRQIGQWVKELPVEEWLAYMTPKQRRELLRRLQENPPRGD
jgi:hypothetical protein